jgi:hypothetical protein
MPSAEGHGKARAAVQALLEQHPEAVPNWRDLDLEAPGWLDQALIPAARRVALRFTADLMGFWLLWHLEGGFEGMRRLGMSETTVWRRVKAFRDAFGAHPDDYEFPGVEVKLEDYWFDPNEGKTPRVLRPGARGALSAKED